MVIAILMHASSLGRKAECALLAKGTIASRENMGIYDTVLPTSWALRVGAHANSDSVLVAPENRMHVPVPFHPYGNNPIGAVARTSTATPLDARSLLLSGMRPPKFLDKENVDGFEKLHAALRDQVLIYTKYQDSVGRNVEDWVAKEILLRGLPFNASTVSDFFEEYKECAI